MGTIPKLTPRKYWLLFLRPVVDLTYEGEDCIGGLPPEWDAVTEDLIGLAHGVASVGCLDVHPDGWLSDREQTQLLPSPPLGPPKRPWATPTITRSKWDEDRILAYELDDSWDGESIEIWEAAWKQRMKRMKKLYKGYDWG